MSRCKIANTCVPVERTVAFGECWSQPDAFGAFVLLGGSASNVPDNPIFTSLSPDFDAFASAVTSRGIPIAVVTFGGEFL